MEGDKKSLLNDDFYLKTICDEGETHETDQSLNWIMSMCVTIVCINILSM